MTDWNRKNAESLKQAVEHHCHKSTGNDRAVLEPVYVEIRQKMSEIINFDDLQLAQLRQSVCSVCRAHSLYACDLTEWWSLNCELLRRNS